MIYHPLPLMTINSLSQLTAEPLLGTTGSFIVSLWPSLCISTHSRNQRSQLTKTHSRNHRIGWWENLQESPTNLMVKTHGFPVKIFPTKPIQWSTISVASNDWGWSFISPFTVTVYRWWHWMSRTTRSSLPRARRTRTWGACWSRDVWVLMRRNGDFTWFNMIKHVLDKPY